MKLQRFAAALFRSITPLTGALIGVLCFGGPVISYELALNAFGRPLTFESSWWWAQGFPVVIELCGGALAGAVFGFVVRSAVGFKRWAGPVDRRVVSVLLLLALGIPSWRVVSLVRRYEAFNNPRVIETTGQIIRSDGPTQLEPPSGAPLLWEFPLGEPSHDLRWNGRAVSARHPILRTRGNTSLVVRTGPETDLLGFERSLGLTLHAPPKTAWMAERVTRPGTLPTITIDLDGFDSPTRVWGVAAGLKRGEPESLVLLVGMRNGLRERDHRALLLILDPQGTMIYKELLRMESDDDTGARLWTVGAKPQSQDILVNVGTPLRYASAR